FVLMLAVTLTLLAVQWRLATEALPQAYTFTLGAMICLQLAIHTRHLRNLFMFRAIAEGDGIRGRLDYSRRTMLRMSALEMAVFSGLYSGVALFTGSAFAFGGAASCLSVAVSHWKLARKQTPSARAVDATASHAT